MKTHPYLRAYMAGAIVPTPLLLVILSAFFVIRYVLQLPIPIERIIVFPMAFVPNVFGVWNMFYLWARPRHHLPIGLHGAILPFLFAPAALTVGCTLRLVQLRSPGLQFFGEVMVPYSAVAIGFVCAVLAYYMVWKYLVNFCNDELGIA
jgi:hypothetical protein